MVAPAWPPCLALSGTVWAGRIHPSLAVLCSLTGQLPTQGFPLQNRRTEWMGGLPRWARANDMFRCVVSPAPSCRDRPYPHVGRTSYRYRYRYRHRCSYRWSYSYKLFESKGTKERWQVVGLPSSYVGRSSSSSSSSALGVNYYEFMIHNLAARNQIHK